MHIKRLVLINQIVEKIQEYKNIKPPINDIKEFIRSLGGTLEVNERMVGIKLARISFFSDSTSNSSNNSSSTGETFPYGKFTITVSTNEFSNRDMKFSLIRELGHLFLHRGFYADKKYLQPIKENDNVKFSLQQENEAKEFAAAFFMPMIQYQERVNQECDKKTINFESIATYFQVPEIEVKNRKVTLDKLNKNRAKNIISNNELDNEDVLSELQSLLNRYMLLKDDRTSLKKSKVKGIMLFVSFDIINSTIYKTQDKNFWPEQIANIFELIRATFYIAFSNAIIWRILGDEIIYIVPLENSSNLTQSLDKVYGTLEDVISDIPKKDNTNLLSLKAAAWIAYVADKKDPIAKKYPQFCNICVNYYMNSKSTGRVIEFLGNDVDLGFRIKAQAFKGALLISFDLARLLIIINESTADQANKVSDIDRDITNKIFIIGFEKLKGIWNNRPYPIICYSSKRNEKDNADIQKDNSGMKNNNMNDQKNGMGRDYDEEVIISNLSYELFEENSIVAKYRDYVFGRGAYPQEFFTNSKKATERICRDNHLEGKIKFLEERLSEGAVCEL